MKKHIVMFVGTLIFASLFAPNPLTFLSILVVGFVVLELIVGMAAEDTSL